MLVILFTFIFLIGFQFIYSKYGPKKPAEPAQQPVQQQAVTPASPVNAQAAVAPAPSAPVAVGTKQAASETDTVIENDLYRITFTNRGAQVKSWVLKKFTDEKRQPLDLVNLPAAKQYGYPLSLFAYDQGLKDKLNSALYVTTVQGTQQSPTDVTFEYAEGNLSVRKTFHFDDSYVVKTDIEVVQNGSAIQAFPAWPSGFGDAASAASFAASTIDFDNGNKIERLRDQEGQHRGHHQRTSGLGWTCRSVFRRHLLARQSIECRARNAAQSGSNPEEPRQARSERCSRRRCARWRSRQSGRAHASADFRRPEGARRIGFDSSRARARVRPKQLTYVRSSTSAGSASSRVHCSPRCAGRITTSPQTGDGSESNTTTNAITLICRAVDLSGVDSAANNEIVYAVERELKASPVFDPKSVQSSPQISPVDANSTFTFSIMVAPQNPLKSVI